MHNLLILGSGRSGTSMTTAMFRESGYYLGDILHEGNASNPFGYYESPTINTVNGILIIRLLFWRTRMPLLGWSMPPVHRDVRALWLAAPRVLVSRRVPPKLAQQMRQIVSREKFCLKDPRFSVTLPTWRPFLPADTRFVVVFRDPVRTVDSILRIAAENYDPPLAVTPEWGYIHWERNYRRLLQQASDGHWLFLNYDDVTSGAAIPTLEAFSGAAVDRSQVDPTVRRSQCDAPHAGLAAARRCAALYEQLRARATDDLQRPVLIGAEDSRP